MNKIVQLFAVALLSAVMSVFLYRQLDGPKEVRWNSGDNGDVRYAGLVEKTVQCPLEQQFLFCSAN